MKIPKSIQTIGLIGCLLLPANASKLNKQIHFGYQKSTNVPEVNLGFGIGSEGREGNLFQAYGGLGLMQQSNELKKSDWLFAPYVGLETMPIGNKKMRLGVDLKGKYFNYTDTYKVIDKIDNGNLIESKERIVKDKYQGFQFIPSVALETHVKGGFGVKLNLGYATGKQKGLALGLNGTINY